MLHFDPQTGLSADSVSTVREAVREDWKAAFRREGLPELNTEPETPAGQLIDSQTAAIVDKDNEVLFLANQFNPLTASGIWQDALGKIYFLTRKTAQASEAVCQCNGLAGTVITQGARIKSSADGAEWVCMEAIVIPAGGTAQARFRSQTPGPVAAQANTLTEIVTVTPGWDSVTNPAVATVGRDVESRLEFETRRYNSVAANARGSVAALYGAIANLPDVLDVVVLENVGNDPIVSWGVTIPGHSVWIAVTGGTDSEIAETIYRKKDAGCGTAGNTQIGYQDAELPGMPIYTYRIERPTPLAFGVRVTLRLTPTTPQDIEQRVKDAILADFNGAGPHDNLRVGTAQEVYASRFYCAVIGAGVQNLVSIEIAAPASGGTWGPSATVNADQAPVLSADDISIVIAGDA
ncbi:baseplate J/gp47 family protein [uncultured Desulfovibrio sp.]|jgi:uncharacterized phage protein gp47/JayE|uniref:baseplate J/gp47 family protein n=1 Tax=uncultured Desulfovibrio sp. TaxID=167968 RepID=UPI002602304F|nr:baseplate J/gp47 family protein [uncultured Desulfovibrio sp.]